MDMHSHLTVTAALNQQIEEEGWDFSTAQALTDKTETM